MSIFNLNKLRELKKKMKLPFVVKFGLIGGSLLAGLVSYYKMNDINRKLEYLKKKYEKNGKKKIYELKDTDYRRFPWATDYKNVEKDEDWEMRRVKIKGVLGKTRFFVRQERDGQPGFLVYSGLLTRYNRQPIVDYTKVEEKIFSKQGIVICLGWIPLSEKKFTYNFKRINAVSQEDSDKKDVFETYNDAYHGVTFTGIEPDDILNEQKLIAYENGFIVDQFHVFEGFLRKQEKDDYLLSKFNDEYYGHLSKLNLDSIAGFNQFQNADSSKYYIHSTDDFLRARRITYPQPISTSHVLDDLEELEKNSVYSKFRNITFISTLFAGLVSLF